MTPRVLMPILACAILGAACGGIDTRPATVDGAPPTSPDAGPEVSPFVPVAIETVIDSLVAAVKAKNLPGSERPPIAVVLKDLTQFWTPVVIGANRMSTRLVTPSVVVAPLTLDPANTPLEEAAALQNQYVQSYLTSKIYKGMAYAVMADNADSVAYIDQFIAQCGPVVTIDSDFTFSNRSYHIATANYQAGFTAGNKLVEVMQPGDSVAVFGTTNTGWTSGIQRAQGAEDALLAAGLNVTPRISPVWDTSIDTDIIVTALLDPVLNIKGLVCMYSNSSACAAAVEAVGKRGQIQIVGFDMTAETKAYFDKGYFHGIAVQRQYYMGELGVLVPYAINVLGVIPTATLLQPILVNNWFIDTGIDVITTSNYDDYMTFLSTLGINS